ncbi:MAG: hypothetical protein ACE37B_03100 [Ilumatobacter sp.]|jgi:hypothetical protein|uniref:hypothetical protein n=1 Tax=Ilumatobacter sp. TaxID=1967498 RepID=UPI00391D9A9F
MAWDSSRPVPWRRLVREWLIYVGIMAILLAIFFRDSGFVGALAGLLISGPLYLGFGFVLAKLGYQRKSLKELRTPRAEPRSSGSSSSDSAGPSRPRPAPTSRTSTGINRPNAKKRKR